MANNLCALLRCWYEGDGNLVDDSLIAIGSREELEAHIRQSVPDNLHLYTDCDPFLDDGRYEDDRQIYRIVDLVRHSTADIFRPRSCAQNIDFCKVRGGAIDA